MNISTRFVPLGEIFLLLHKENTIFWLDRIIAISLAAYLNLEKKPSLINCSRATQIAVAVVLLKIFERVKK